MQASCAAWWLSSHVASECLVPSEAHYWGCWVYAKNKINSPVCSAHLSAWTAGRGTHASFQASATTRIHLHALTCCKDIGSFGSSQLPQGKTVETALVVSNTSTWSRCQAAPKPLPSLVTCVMSHVLTSNTAKICCKRTSTTRQN
jgi:hypothetical protein